MSFENREDVSIRFKSPIFSDGLKGRSIFLSASFPMGERAKKFPAADGLEITSAVVALTRAVFGARGKLTFGGHPTISPLVLSVSRDFVHHLSDQERRSVIPLVYIYQSEHFRKKKKLPEETRKLEEEGVGKIVWSEDLDDLGLTLREMRVRMLREREPVAGVFIGGMEGVYKPKGIDDEFHLFTSICKNRPVYPIGATGGAARTLLEMLSKDHGLLTSWKSSRVDADTLFRPHSYSVLMRDIVLDIIGGLGARDS